MRSLNPWPIFPTNLEIPVIRSLSLQFIIQGLIDAFERAQEFYQAFYYQLQGANFQEELACISKELEKILLFSLENPFAQKGSILDKLCFYSEILLQASPLNNDEIPQILDEMRKSIMLVKSKMAVWKKMKPPFPLNTVREEFSALHNFLIGKLHAFFVPLSLFLKESRSDENVLIQLIENREKLNGYLGEKCIEKLLMSFFPAGHSQLRAVIHEGYTRRGFTKFLSNVEPLIDAIEWEASCHLTQTS